MGGGHHPVSQIAILVIVGAIGVTGGAAVIAAWRRRVKRRQRKRNTTALCVPDPLMNDVLMSKTIDMVYVFTFPKVPHVHNISPFSLKVESFLRLYNIPHEVIASFTFSSKGQMPYIRINSQEDGEEIPDSNVIIKFLSNKFGIDVKEAAQLTAAELSYAHAVTRMLEEHTTQIGFYYRYGLHMHDFDRVVIPSDWFGTITASASSSSSAIKTWLVSKAWTYMMQYAFQQKLKYTSFGRHSHEEIWAFSCDDIQSISDFLGEKEYFFGDVATAIDCTLFSHLVQFLDIPLDFPQKQYMHNHCSNLVQYVQRFKNEYWKEDWDAVS